MYAEKFGSVLRLVGTSITFPLWGRLTPWPTHQSEVQTIYKMVALNDKAPSNKSTALVLTNDNEVPVYGFYGFNYHNKNLKKNKLNMYLTTDFP